MARASRSPISMTPGRLRWVLAAAALPLVLGWVALALSPARAAGDCTVSASEAALDGEEQAMLDAVNTYRQQKGLGTLTASPGLNRAAAWMSKDMAVNNHLLHTDSLGRDTVTRMGDCGWTGFHKGENLASGTTSAAQTLDLWKNSAVHNQQLLQPVFKVAGIGRYGSGGLLGSFWTMNMGGITYTDTAPGGSSGPPAPAATPTRVVTAAPPPASAVVATPFPTVVTSPVSTNPLSSAAITNAAPANTAGGVRFQVNLVGTNGLPVVGDMSGYSFTLAGSGGAYTSSPTDASGSTLLSVPAGLYSIMQQPKAGTTPLSLAISSGPASTITVSSGATMAVTATNQIASAVTAAPASTTSVPVAVLGPVQFAVSLSAMGGAAPQGSLDGYVFTLTAMTGASYSTPPTDAQGRTQIDVPAGTYALSQQPKAGSTVVGFADGSIPAATVTVVAGQPKTITVTNDVTGAAQAVSSQASAAAPAGSLTSVAMEAVTLVAGCTNVPMTWPAGTPLTTVAAEIGPSGALDAIWRWDSARNAYLGYSAAPNAPADYTTVQQKFEAAFVCMKSAGRMSRPTG